MTEKNYFKINEINKKLEQYPNDFNLLMQKAFLYFQGYDDDNPIKTYKKIIDLFPLRSEAYFWLSYYLFRIACDPDQAILIAKKGLKIDPNNVALYAVLAWATDFANEDKNQYVDYLKKSLELDPTWLSTRISLIEYSIEAKDFMQAKKEILEAQQYVNSNNLASSNEEQREYELITRRNDLSASKVLESLLVDVDKVLDKK